MAHILMISVGSLGDVLPLIAIGRALLSRGHEVSLLSGAGFRSLAGDYGVPFIPLAGAGEHEHRRQLGGLLSSNPVEFLNGPFITWNRDIHDRILDLDRGGPALVLSVHNYVMTGDLLACESRQVPLVRLLVEPPAPASAARATSPTAADNIAERATAALVKHAGFDSCCGSAVALVKSIRSRTPNYGLWPDWFTAGSAFPGLTGCLGFIYPPEESRLSQPIPKLGPGHIVFSAGTMGTLAGWAEHFEALCRHLCVSLESEGILLGVPARPLQTPPLCCAEYHPLAEALQGAELLVHHGGMGTAAQALRFGVPQVVIPRTWSQRSNADWLRKLGVAEVWNPAQGGGGGFVDCARRVLASPAQRQKCLELSRQCTPAEICFACGMIEDRIAVPAEPSTERHRKEFYDYTTQ